jgi:recombination protein RecR
VKEKGPIEDAIKVIASMPGFGEKSASRLVYWLLGAGKDALLPLISSLSELASKIKICAVCGNFSMSDPCEICSDAARDSSVLMVVADGKDVTAIEKTRSYKGKYFLLGGLLSPRLGIGPESLRIAELLKRLKSEPIKEVIIALSSSQEGETTSQWLVQQMAGIDVRITRLARGLPVATSIEYLDAESLKLAIEGRKEF